MQLFPRVRQFTLFTLSILILTRAVTADQVNLVQNSDFELRAADGGGPAGYQLNGDVEYRYLGDPNRDVSGWGAAFRSAGDGERAGSVWQWVTGIDAKPGRWFRFTFRGLPQDNFAVTDDDLSMRVEFFGDGGKTSYDAKGESIYPLIEEARRV